jgi:hypothetical protein
MTRKAIDKLAWQSIHRHPPRPVKESCGWQPMDYQGLEQRLQEGAEFEHIWSDFLHAFYDYKDASFFRYPSPISLSTEWQALLAGAAEWLSDEFGIEPPKWIDLPEYFLAEPWDRWRIWDWTCRPSSKRNCVSRLRHSGSGTSPF